MMMSHLFTFHNKLNNKTNFLSCIQFHPSKTLIIRHIQEGNKITSFAINVLL
jgi:hypothetical protein